MLTHMMNDVFLRNMMCCFATLRIGSAYDRLYKWVRATPVLNYSLFIIHYSLNKNNTSSHPFLHRFIENHV